MAFERFLAKSNLAFDSLSEVFPTNQAYFYTTLAFFIGVGIIALIDYLIPNERNPHELQGQGSSEDVKKKSLLRLGVFTAIAIAIHNFPEGLATFIQLLKNQP